MMDDFLGIQVIILFLEFNFTGDRLNFLFEIEIQPRSLDLGSNTLDLTEKFVFGKCIHFHLDG